MFHSFFHHPHSLSTFHCSFDHFNYYVILIFKKSIEVWLKKKEDLASKTLLPPHYDPLHKVEFSVHTCSSLMQREIPLIFPEIKKNEVPHLLIVPVYQQSTVDLVGMGPHVEDEKNRLLLSVFTFFSLCFYSYLISFYLFFISKNEPRSFVILSFCFLLPFSYSFYLFTPLLTCYTIPFIIS